MKKNALVAVFLLIFAWGCSLHPEYLRRYKDAQWGPVPAGASYVTVSAFTLDTPSAAPQNLLFQLAPQGEAALVKTIAEKMQGKTLKEFLDQLSKPTAKQGSDVLLDKTVFKKQIVFAVGKMQDHPNGKPIVGLADRINDIVITLEMSKEENKEIADFASWDKFSTSYDLVNLGTVTGTHGYSAELDLTTPAIGGVGATPKISTTGSLQEAAQLNSRYIVISGQIDPKKQKAVLQEQGAVGIDLAGTFTVNFEIRLDPGRGLPPHQRVAVIGPFSEEDKGGKSLAKDVNKIAKPESVKVDFANILYKRTADPITCKLSYDYTLRHVNGIDERELVEGLQSVQYLRGSVTVPGDIELVGRKDLLVTVYKIAIGPVGKYETGRMLALMNDEGKTLYFPTSESASEFLRWLKDGKSLTVAKYRLGVVDVTCQGGRHFSDKRPLKKEEVNQMIVHAEVLNPDEKYIAETQCP